MKIFIKMFKMNFYQEISADKFKILLYLVMDLVLLMKIILMIKNKIIMQKIKINKSIKTYNKIRY